MLSLDSNYQSYRLIETSTQSTNQFFGKKANSSSIQIENERNFSLNLKIFSLFEDIKALEDNWDEDGAKKPCGMAIQNSQYLVQLLSKRGIEIYHIAPGPTGEIMIDLRNDNNSSIEILFYEHNSKFVKFPKSGNPEQGEFQFVDLPNLLKWLQRDHDI